MTMTKTKDMKIGDQWKDDRGNRYEITDIQSTVVSSKSIEIVQKDDGD